MIKKITFCILFLVASLSYGQTYTMNNGNNGIITTCSGTFSDNIGGFNYWANQLSTITFSPTVPGAKVKINFSSFDTQSFGALCYDYLKVWYASSITNPATPDQLLCGNLGAFSLVSTSPDGCITLQFISDTTIQRAGWVATLSCVMPCNPPIAAFTDASTVDICSPDSVQPMSGVVSFNGSASSSPSGNTIMSYEWNWGDNTPNTITTVPTTTHNFTTPGIYVVKLKVRDNNYDTYDTGCSSSNSAIKTIRVFPSTKFSTPTTIAASCGNSVTLNGQATSQTITQVTPAQLPTPVKIPNNTGTALSSSIDFSGMFPAGQTITPGCYPTLHFNLEHSFSADLTIDLVSPSGQSVRVFNRGNAGGPSSSGINIGTCANNNDDGVPGCGADYSVVNSGGVSWDSPAASTMSTTPCSTFTGPCDAFGYYIAQTYTSANSFSAFNGGNLNGVWSLVINDVATFDDGTLFGWSLTFPSSCYSSLQTLTPAISSLNWSQAGGNPPIPTQTTTNTVATDPGPGACPVPGTCVGNTLTNTISVGPFNTPGSYVYTLTSTNQLGCQNTKNYTINVTCITCGFTLLSPTTTTNQTICQNSPINNIYYSKTGNLTSITFSGLPPGVTSSVNGTTITISGTPTTAGIYTYTITTVGCFQNVTATGTITVSPTVSAGTLSGSAAICLGSSPTYTSTITGGTWSSSNTAVATINATSGVLTSLTSGTTTLTYAMPASGACPAATATLSVTVSPTVSAGTLSGLATICLGSTTTFTSTIPGGTWSSSDTTIATIHAVWGIITAVAAGTATITYTKPAYGACPAASATGTITVSPTVSAGTINGSAGLCVGSIETYTSTITGGTWISSNTAAATINATSGVLTSLSSGSVTLTYTMPASGACPAATTTKTIMLWPTVSAGTLSGLATICLGSTTTFTSTIPGGTWSSSDTTIATINATSGVITAVAAGIATITYTKPAYGACPSASATLSVSVSPSVSAGTLSGSTSICLGSAPMYSSTVTGGTWSSSNTAVATINATSGVLTSLSSGSVTLTYTMTASGACPAATATKTITVSPTVSAGTINGSADLCVGSIETYTSTITGGTWISSNTAAATINATSGVLTSLSSGSVTLTYTMPASGACPGATTTKTIMLWPTVSAGTLSGLATICLGSTTTFTSTIPGGTWSSSDTTIATINATSGVITAVAAGTATITYTKPAYGACPAASATKTITVSPTVSAGTINGSADLCVGSIETYTSTITGGTWISSNTAAATINATSGVLTSLSSGSVTLTYTMPASGACPGATTTKTIMLWPTVSAGTLSGSTTICLGSSPTYTSTVAGGTWTSSNIAVATINSTSGVLTSLSAGTTTLTYTKPASGGCPSASATLSVSVSPSVSAGTLSGSTTICLGSTATYTSTVTGGTWSSSNTAVATINATSGVLTSLSSGSVTLTYTMPASGACPAASATLSVSVSPSVSAGTLSGSASICMGSTATYTSTVAGGTWSSSDTTIATINATSGVITAVAAGIATITYTKPAYGACPAASATKTITVSPTVSAGTINGSADLCVGSTETYTSTITGGTWSSSNTAVATINATSGVLTSLTAGTTTLTYTMTASGACPAATATKTITVSPSVSAGTLSGSASICMGSTATYTSTVSGGTWSSSNTAVATINATSGVLTSLTSGTTTLTYTMPASGACPSASATLSVSVSPSISAGTLSGSASICMGSTATYTSTVSGGTWSSSNTAVATINATSGVLTSLTSGTTTLTYTMPASGACPSASATLSVSVSPSISAGTLSGSATICMGSTATYTSTVAGGTWSSSDTTIATIDATSGVLTSFTSGTTTLTYIMPAYGACPAASATLSVSVSPSVSAGTLSGSTSICMGSTATYTSTVAGGTWSSSDTTIATIDATSGVLTSLTSGTTTLTYSMPASGACPSASATLSVSVSPSVSAGTLSGSTTICMGSTATYTSTVSGGTWSSSNTAVATINATSGVLTSLTSGTTTLTYTMPASGACPSASATLSVSVSPSVSAGTLSGSTTICMGSTATYTSTVTGGTWSSSNTAVATINATSGVLTSLTSGTTTLTYSMPASGACPSASATLSVSVSPSISAGTLSGSTTICMGSTATYTSTVTGGTWSSSDTTIATIDATSGMITAVFGGSATMTYTIPASGACSAASATKIITVSFKNSFGKLGGLSTICLGGTTTLTSTISGGTWSSSNTSIATINATTGVVTTVALGSVIMTYTVSSAGPCPAALGTKPLTVASSVSTGTLSGSATICLGSTATYSSTVAGGTWSSSNTAVATISATSGVLTSLSAGTTTLTYTKPASGSCPAASATLSVTVSPTVSAGTLSGSATICLGSSPTYTSTVAGGTWTSSNIAVATINSTSGVLTSLSAGTTTLTYTKPASGSCPAASATKTITVSPSVSAGTLSGSATICLGSSPTYTSTVTGGTWTSSNTAVATINATSGVLTSLSAGTTTLTYIMPASVGCPSASAAKTITILPSVSAGTLSGPTTICLGSTATYSSTVAGGTWSSSNTAVATINATSGIVTAVAAGTATITYSIDGQTRCSSASVTTTITVLPVVSAGTLSGIDYVCLDDYSAIITSTVHGGVWSSSDISIVEVDSINGTISPNNPGTATISYTVFSTNSCPDSTVSQLIKVIDLPDTGIISSNTSVCVGGTTLLTSTVPGGIWTSSDITVADIDPHTGVVHGFHQGNTIIFYTVTNAFGCSNYTKVDFTVDDATITPTFSFPTIYCKGDRPSSLPSVSDNGILGVWTPNTIDTSYSAHYTFIPDPHFSCAVQTTIDVTIVGGGTLTANGDVYSIPYSTAAQTTPSIINNDYYNGALLTTVLLSYTIATGGLPAGFSINNDGTINIAAGTPPGTYSFGYYIYNECMKSEAVKVAITISGPTISCPGKYQYEYFCYNGASQTSLTGFFDPATWGDHIGILVNNAPATANTVTVHPTAISGVNTPAGITMNPNGTVTISNSVLPGYYQLYVYFCQTANPSVCTPIVGVGVIVNTTIQAVNDTIYYSSSGTLLYGSSNVLANDVYSCANPVSTPTTSNVTIVQNTPNSGGFSIDTSTGNIVHSGVYSAVGSPYQIIYTITDNSFPLISSSAQVNIDVQNINLKTSDKQDNDKNNIEYITVYPNPSKGIFNINFNKVVANASIEVYNLLGQQVFKDVANNSNEYSLQLNNLPSGGYLLKVYDGTQLIEKQIIKE